MVTTTDRESLKQNSQFTFKHNLNHGRHGWLRLTPAYSVKIVTGILDNKTGIKKVLDPFSGTGTTALCASYLGLESVGLEINPFLTWFSTVKTRQYHPTTIRNVRELGESIINDFSFPGDSTSKPPPIHNIFRWWNQEELDFLCRLKSLIYKKAEKGSKECNFLLIAFCRTLITISNAAFNHQSMSFKNNNGTPRLFDLTYGFPDLFRGELLYVLDSAAYNPITMPLIVEGDARQPSRFLNDRYDILISSPPYPNRISYIRELRPYMYWLDFLTNGRDAGELDWQAIGGTWGIATSRLVNWIPAGNGFIPTLLKKAIYNISKPENKNGLILANYIARYFEDTWNHISDVRSILNENAEVHYIVGNSTFYGTLLPVEEIYKEMLENAGFRDVQVRRIRKRNSKAELFEYDVTGKKI